MKEKKGDSRGKGRQRNTNVVGRITEEGNSCMGQMEKNSITQDLHFHLLKGGRGVKDLSRRGRERRMTIGHARLSRTYLILEIKKAPGREFHT